MINALSQRPELGSANGAEAGRFMAYLRDLPNALHISWQTRKYSPDNLHPTNVPAAALGKVGIAAVGAAYATLSYLQTRHGMDYGHTAPDYILAGHDTHPAPSPDSSDDSGNPWLLPGTESTHKESAVPVSPTYSTPEPTHAEPTPIQTTSVEPTHPKSVHPTTSPTDTSPSGYDDYPDGGGEQPDELTNQNSGFHATEIACFACPIAMAGIGLGLWGLHRVSQRNQSEEHYDSILRDPGEA